MRLVTPACGGRRGFFAVCRLVEGGLGNNYCVLNISLRRGYLASLIAIFFVIACVATAQADVFHRYWIRGPIYEAYVRLGGHGFFGDAIRNEAQLPDGGKFQEFHKDTSIYWHPDADSGIAHQIGGAIRGKWGQLGWEKGRLGYPVTDELSLPNREGKFNHFQNGSIYWSPETGAHVIDGRIREKRPDLQFRVNKNMEDTGDVNLGLYKNGIFTEFDSRSSNRAFGHGGSALFANPGGTVLLVELDSSMLSKQAQEALKDYAERVAKEAKAKG